MSSVLDSGKARNKKQESRHKNQEKRNRRIYGENNYRASELQNKMTAENKTENRGRKESRRQCMIA
jgi:hypothetical protein